MSFDCSSHYRQDVKPFDRSFDSHKIAWDCKNTLTDVVHTFAAIKYALRSKPSMSAPEHPTEIYPLPKRHKHMTSPLLSRWCSWLRRSERERKGAMWRQVQEGERLFGANDRETRRPRTS